MSNYLKEQRCNIYCLQDVHFTESDDKYIKSQWDGTVLFSSYKSNARGVCILFNNNFEYRIESLNKDNDGNIITVNIKLKTINTLL